MSRRFRGRHASVVLRTAPIAALALVLLVLSLPITHAETAAQVRTTVADAFVAVADAESSGGDVGGLVDRLNEALALIAQGESVERSDPEKAQKLYQQAEDIASQVTLQASSARDAGIVAQRNRMVLLAVELIGLAIAGFAVYRFGPRLFWNLWLHTHSGWRVRRHDR